MARFCCALNAAFLLSNGCAHAARLGREDLVKMRLGAGANRNRATPKFKMIALDFATRSDRWRCTQMRLSCRDFGLHRGVVEAHPAAHGCIRLPSDAARKLFAEIPVGTLVSID